MKVQAAPPQLPQADRFVDTTGDTMTGDLILDGATKLQFRDANVYFSSPASNYLDLFADELFAIRAPSYNSFIRFEKGRTIDLVSDLDGPSEKGLTLDAVGPAGTPTETLISVFGKANTVRFYNALLGLPQLTSDPDTTGWGAPEKGRMWFNTVANVIKYWDGTAIKTVTAM